jgi:acyl-CoA synthetase (AMP-forming)/AMP-acid ligase II
VEEALLRSEMLVEVFAFGTDDERLGQKIEVVVRPSAPEAFEAQHLLRWCKGAMAAYLVPARIHVRQADFPRNSNGKVDGPVLVRSLQDELP